LNRKIHTRIVIMSLVNRMNSKILDKNDIDIVVYDENLDQFGGAFIVWHYYCIKFGKERANKIQYLSNDDIIAVVHKLSLKNVLLIGDADCVSKIYDVTSAFMQIKNVEYCWNHFFPDVSMPRLFDCADDRNFMIIFLEKMSDFQEWGQYFDPNLIDECSIRGKIALMNKQTMMTETMKQVTHIMQDIGGMYMYMVYAEAEYFKSEVCTQLYVKYPICDICVAYHYDADKNVTTYCIKSIDDTKILKNHVGMMLNGSFWMKLDGKCDLLPYRTINDLGLLKKMRNRINGIVAVKKKKYNYVLMDVAEIREEWIENEFSAFLKRKNEESSLIVFGKPSDDIQYDQENHTMIVLRDYVIMYNDKALTDGLKNLQFNLCNNEYLLCVTSDKEFADIFLY